MAKLTDDELKNLKPIYDFHCWGSSRLPYAQLDKLFNEVRVAEIDNYPGHTDKGEGKNILRVDEDEIYKLAAEAHEAGKGFLREGVKFAETDKDLIVQVALGNLAIGCDQPGGQGKPRRYYISEAKLIECLDAIDPTVIKKVETYGQPTLHTHHVQELIGKAEVVTNAPGYQGKRAYRVTEDQVSQYSGGARSDGWGSRLSHGNPAGPLAKLGYLVVGYDGEVGKRRFYIPQEKLDRFIGNKPLTHDEIYQLQRMRETGVSGGTPKAGFKEFSDSKLTGLLGASWRARLEGYWEEAPGTGQEDVAAVNMEALSSRMQQEKKDSQARRESGYGSGYGRRPYGGGYGGGRRW